MQIQEELRSIARKLQGMCLSVPKSRNRHREINISFTQMAEKILELANAIQALQDICDTNMTLFESLIDLFERGHISINPDSPQNIKDLAEDLFGNMRNLIAEYQAAKESKP